MHSVPKLFSRRWYIKNKLIKTLNCLVSGLKRSLIFEAKDLLDKKNNKIFFTHTIIKECDSVNKDSVPESKQMFTDLAPHEKPDMVDSDNISLFDLHEDMQTVDAIPVAELNKRVKTEGDELLEEVWRKESPDEKQHFDNA